MGKIDIDPTKVIYDGHSFKRIETPEFKELLIKAHKSVLEEHMKEFKVKINRRDIAQIVDSARQLRIEDINFIRAATVDDVQCAHILLSLTEFLRERRCEPDFEVCLGE